MLNRCERQLLGDMGYEVAPRPGPCYLAAPTRERPAGPSSPTEGDHERTSELKPILERAAEIAASYSTAVTLRQLFYRLVAA